MGYLCPVINRQVHTSTMARKKRTDRNHLIYQITCIDSGDQYIGVTVAKGAAVKRTLEPRWKAHLYKAQVVRETWSLPRAIRKYGEVAFTIELLQKVRGKKEAFSAEAQLINSLYPSLNTRRKVESGS